MIKYKPTRKDKIRVNLILWALFFTLGFASSQTFAQVSTTVPIETVDLHRCSSSINGGYLYGYFENDQQCMSALDDYGNNYVDSIDNLQSCSVRDVTLTEEQSSYFRNVFTYDCLGGTSGNIQYSGYFYAYHIKTATQTEQRCPASHPTDNGDGTCSLAPPEQLSDCPIGTKPSLTVGQLGNGSSSECVPFSCASGGANVSIPSTFFDLDFGTAGFSYCDGSCAYSVQSGSGGDVNAWGTGMACGNGTPDYVYAVPTFDDVSCTSGDGWVDCSDNPQKVDEDNPPPSPPPATPDDIGVPLEQEGDFVNDALPDCTAETALSGSCFVNSMVAVQGNIVGGINAEQSQQTDRIVKALVETMNGNASAISELGNTLGKALKEGERVSSLPFLTQQFASVSQDDVLPLTTQNIADGAGEDITGINFDEIIPKVTRSLGWNPSEYQFGVGGGLCPEPTVLVIGGQNIELDWSMFCDMALIINALLIAMAYFIGGQIIMRAM